MKNLKFKSTKFNMRAILMLVALASVLVTSCSDDPGPDVPPTEDAALKYMALVTTASFKQSFTDNINEVITEDLPVLERSLTTKIGKKYTYTYKPTPTEQDIIEVLTLDGSKIWTKLSQEIHYAGQSFSIDLEKIPLLDLDITTEKQYVDTILKFKVNIKDLIGSPIDVEVNVDVKITSKLTPKANKTLTINGLDIAAISFVNVIDFTIITNDKNLDIIGYNNKLLATGSFTLENWFSEKYRDAYLGIVYHSEATKVKDEFMGNGVVVDMILTRTMTDYVGDAIID